jgi:hypothetical protein
MERARFLGGILPPWLHLSVQSSEIGSTWPEEGIEVAMTVLLSGGNVVVDCTLDRFEPRYVPELYSRAMHMANAIANMAMFATGRGVQVFLAEFQSPDGSRAPLERRLEIPEHARSAFGVGDSFDPAIHVDVLNLVMTEPSAFLALDDLASAVWSLASQLAYCGRVVDGIRRAMVPTLKDAAAWTEMQRLLNLSQAYQQYVTNASRGPRHGDWTQDPNVSAEEVLQRAWAIFNRFLHYRKGGNIALTAPDFPEL